MLAHQVLAAQLPGPGLTTPEPNKSLALYPVSLLTTAIAAIPDVTAWAGGKLSYTHMAGVKGHGGQHMDREKRYVA